MPQIQHTRLWPSSTNRNTIRKIVWGEWNWIEENSYAKAYKSPLVGIGAGLAVLLVLFLPITALLIQSSIQHIVIILAGTSQKPILAENPSHSITSILLMSIVFHMIWGQYSVL